MGYTKNIFYGFRSRFMDWIFVFSAVIPKENKKVESLLSKVASFVSFMPNWQKWGHINHQWTFKSNNKRYPISQKYPLQNFKKPEKVLEIITYQKMFQSPDYSLENLANLSKN